MKTPATVLLCLLLIAALAGLACKDDGEHTTVLPTVQASTATPADRFVTCHDLCGKEPDEMVGRTRAEQNPRFCFVSGDCYFNCRPPACS